MKRITRDRVLTAEEASHDRRVRELIEEEKPEIAARIRSRIRDARHAPADEPQSPKRRRPDGQLTALAGNAKAVDLLAVNPTTGRAFTVQVKSLRKRDFFPIGHSRVHREHVYVFTILNRPGQSVQYFVVPGAVLADDPGRFGKWFIDPKFPGIYPNALAEFVDAWQVFDEP